MNEVWHARSGIAAMIAAIKDGGYLHIPEGAATIPPPPKPSASTTSIKTEADIHGTRRSPVASSGLYR